MFRLEHKPRSLSWKRLPMIEGVEKRATTSSNGQISLQSEAETKPRRTRDWGNETMNPHPTSWAMLLQELIVNACPPKKFTSLDFDKRLSPGRADQEYP
ncbi:hypothetical protein I7I50_01972 [Histoplasma capsulatum G186AR]|uniref:Uncharacterized protein n=1 Tax=Ajellomyces capsulatus TaxID=5037 RepID=A0A8H7YFV1_AJECA|nr:hypothetical protein I7I52_12186 [Histoplasma capsulatum]QSS71218.1 hypothetical protein I7I50_01972 [Histoplasma capsulatum G186AR]